jgi:hypothetical protein
VRDSNLVLQKSFSSFENGEGSSQEAETEGAGSDGGRRENTRRAAEMQLTAAEERTRGGRQRRRLRAKGDGDAAGA